MRSPHAKLLLAAGIGLLTWLLVPSPGRTAADDPDRGLKALQKERVAVLTDRVALARKAAEAGAGRADDVLGWEEQLAVAKADLDGDGTGLRKLYERRVAGLREREQKAEKAQKAGGVAAADLLELRAARLDAEINLARLK